MLDRIVVREQFGGGDNAQALYASVIDGHGSATNNVVDLVADKLHRVVAVEWSAARVASASAQRNASLEATSAQRAFDAACNSVAQLVRADARARTSGAVAVIGVLQPTPSLCDDNAAAAGVAFASLLTAHVGDCAVVVSRRVVAANERDAYSATRLGGEHRASNEAERARIEAAGGRVRAGRIGGMLEPSRAFGDAKFPAHILIATPEVTALPLDASIDALVFASDGLWDFVTPHAAMAIARDRAMTAHAAAKQIVRVSGIKNVCRVSCQIDPFNYKKRFYYCCFVFCICFCFCFCVCAPVGA